MIYWYDCVFLIFILVVCTLIGIYFGCSGTKHSTTKEYLFGSKSLTSFPVGISMSISLYSSIGFLSVPADVYKYGINYAWNCLAAVFTAVALYYIYLPVYFSLQVTSSLEYLRRRFDERSRSFALALVILKINLVLPVVMYSASLCFASMAELNVNLVSVVVCGLCVFYTTIGGIRTVVWTDGIQFLVILVAGVAIFATGLQSNNIENVWVQAKKGDRLDLWKFEFDPTRRESFWSVVLGSGVQLIYQMGLAETGITKLLTLRHYKSTRMALCYMVLTFGLLIMSGVVFGLQLYARYDKCNPFVNTTIKKHDQLFLYYVTDISQGTFGITSLFIAAVFCCSLSTISSMLNAASCIIYHEVLIKCLKSTVSEQKRGNILKMIVLFQGILSIVVSLLVQYFGEIFPLVISIAGLVSGPLLGMITLGVLFSNANSFGAFYGGIGGFLSIAAVVLPAKYYQMKGIVKYATKIMPVKGCSVNDTTILNQNATTVVIGNTTPVPSEWGIFNMSYYYYIYFGLIPTVVLGLLLSYVTKNKHPEVDEQLLSPIVHKVLNRSSSQKDTSKSNTGEPTNMLPQC